MKYISNKIIDCDLDGVLCSEEKTFDKSLAVPHIKQIKILNKLYKNNIIIIHTARSWAEYRMTKKQLKKWGIKYHSLICGKIVADIRIDDRSVKSLKEI